MWRQEGHSQVQGAEAAGPPQHHSLTSSCFFLEVVLLLLLPNPVTLLTLSLGDGGDGAGRGKIHPCLFNSVIYFKIFLIISCEKWKNQ